MFVADEPELRDPDELGRGERAFPFRLVDPAMGDQLDDVAGRVMEVARERVPVVEVEDGIPGVWIG